MILYSDPNCPFCYALGERLLALGLDEVCEWRGVQHAPELPIPRATGLVRFNAMIEQEVRAIQHLAPEVPIRNLTGKPNTGPAIRHIAAVAAQDAAAGRRFRHAVYRALWQDNRDISDPAVLGALAVEAGVSVANDESAARVLTVEWTDAWVELGVGSVPLLHRADGELLSGLVSPNVLRTFVKG
ncbi:MAG: DsbA family protein [Nitrospiraceae bacterium]